MIRVVFFSLLSVFVTFSVAAFGDAEDKTSTTGATFVRDYTNPMLGQAYKDPSGIIWGEVVSENGQVKRMSQLEAFGYCMSVKASLPSREQYQQLAWYLGAGFYGKGYSAKAARGNSQVLPGIEDLYWTSTGSEDSHHAVGFNGKIGYAGYCSRAAFATECSDDELYSQADKLAVRCVNLN